jgi:hypothetical protein
MPNTTYLNVPSVITSNKPWCKKGIDLAVARGFSKVRFSVGLENVPYSNSSDWSTVPADHLANLVECVQYAATSGLTAVALLLNVAPKRSANFMAELGITSADWHAKTCPPDEVTEYTALYWQQMVDAVSGISITRDWEWLNEPGRGGNQQPKDDDGTFTGDFSALTSGQISSRFATILADLSADVDFGSDVTSCLTLEAEGTSVATAEVDSISGATWETVIDRADRIHTNRYADFVAIPYVAADWQAAFSTKVQAQITRMTNNALIAGKTKGIREFGIRSTRCPPCTHYNTVRQALLEQMENEANIVEAGLYCAYRLGDENDPDDLYYTYNYLDNTPIVIAGASVHITA